MTATSASTVNASNIQGQRIETNRILLPRPTPLTKLARGKPGSGGATLNIQQGTDNMRDSVKVVVMALSLAGVTCGSSGGSKNVAGFVGVWSPASGVYTQTCPGDDANTGTSQVTDTETWAMGTTSDLVQTIPGTSCVLHADISASTATATPANQTCTVTSTGG
ncbi:MAG TPA: hypothetical protein VIK30_16275, partial [Polyangia bacterium]